MAKVILDDVQNLYGNTTAAETTINNNFTRIETALENTLSRDGTLPNNMSTNLDMNSNRVTNLADGVASTDAVTVRQLSAITEPTLVLDDIVDVQYTGAPSTGQVLTRSGDIWTNTSLADLGGVNTLDDLQDVVVDTPLDGQALVYNAGAGEWQNTTNPVGVTDHGLLTGLSDDDHSQYYNTTRGDARWVLRSTTVTGASSVQGGGDLTSNRTLSLVNDSATPSGSNYYGTNASGTKGWHQLPAPTTDHGGLSGLGDDDHPQYINQTRGNALYASSTHTHANYVDRAVAESITGQWSFTLAPRVTGAGAMLYHGGSGNLSGRVTVSTSPPSGGADGDIWIVLV